MQDTPMEDNETGNSVEYMRDVDPTCWKSTLYVLENHVNETGIWAQAYSCADRARCAKFCSAGQSEHPSDATVDSVKFLLKASIRNPCFISLLVCMTCAETAHLIEQYEDSYVPPTELPVLNENYSSFKLRKTKLSNVVNPPCTCK